MNIPQLSVFLENRPHSLLEPLQALAAAGQELDVVGVAREDLAAPGLAQGAVDVEQEAAAGELRVALFEEGAAHVQHRDAALGGYALPRLIDRYLTKYQM